MQEYIKSNFLEKIVELPDETLELSIENKDVLK
jgi:hypothetical protein